MTDEYHVPVLGRQAVEILITDPNGVYLDCTVGGGGHSLLLLQALGPRGRLIGCDRDPDAIEHARQALPSSVQLFRLPFSQIALKLRDAVPDGATGVFFDLGVSSYQIDQPQRGFSHRFPGPLDLRMDPTQGETAAQFIAGADLHELTRTIREYGEDGQALRISRAIIRERERTAIDTTDHLALIVSEAVPATRIKSLARVFQALRMRVNHELEELAVGLEAAWSLLALHGRIAVISYHSLEDRMVKQFMHDKAHPRSEPRLPFPPTTMPTGRLLLRKPLTPDETEISMNPRSRSAKLRAVERIA